MADCSITREGDWRRAVYRLAGAFDRMSAWSLRETIEREPAREVVLDFSHVRDFSDLGVAVLATGLAPRDGSADGRRVTFRGLRQHQLRIFRYCGVPLETSSDRPGMPGVGEDASRA